MKKLLAIVVMGLLLGSNAFAKEIILNCYKLDPEGSQKVAAAVAMITGTKIDSEIDLQKKSCILMVINLTLCWKHKERL